MFEFSVACLAFAEDGNDNFPSLTCTVTICDSLLSN